MERLLRNTIAPRSPSPTTWNECRGDRRNASYLATKRDVVVRMDELKAEAAEQYNYSRREAMDNYHKLAIENAAWARSSRHPDGSYDIWSI
jgi:hypothetical protein